MLHFYVRYVLIVIARSKATKQSHCEHPSRHYKPFGSAQGKAR